MMARFFTTISLPSRRLIVASLLSALCSTLALANTARAEAAFSGVAPATNFASEQAAPGYFSLASSAVVADVFVNSGDWQVAQIAARDLAADVERVTGRKPVLKQTTEGLTENAVLVGTLGKSPVIDRLVKEGRLDVKDVQGQWESFVIATVADPQRYQHDTVRNFLVRWAARDLDPRFAEEIASIMEEYYRLGFTRRPEHLVQASRNNPLKYSWFSHTESNDEAMQRVDQYDAIARRAQAIYDQLPAARKDAFFQLVLYPVQCASSINRKVILADKSTRHGNEGRACASEDAAKAEDAAARIIELTAHYNTGKGDIQWSATPSQPWVQLNQTSGTFATEQRLWVSIDWNRAPTGEALTVTIEVTSRAGNKSITVPIFKPAAPLRDAVTGFVESHGYVSMEAEHFTRKHDRGGAAWEVIKGLGRSGDSVTVLPPTVPSHTVPEQIKSSSPSLDYDIYLFHSGDARLDIDCLPTKPAAPKRGVELAVCIDEAAPQILTGKGGDTLSNLRRLTTTVKITSPGKHTLTVWMVDPGVVMDKLVLDFTPAKDTYLGPPESFRR